MPKYTILGDIHGRTIWRDIIKKEKDSDKFIFLGDYVTTHDPNVTEDQQIEELYGILDFKEKNKDKVILLRGNHDVQTLGYYWARCYPQPPRSVAEYMQTKDVSRWFLNNTQWVYIIPDTNIVCSHAGIGEKFLDNVNKYYKTHINPDENIRYGIADINNIEPCELFGFTPCRMSDNNGDSATQPCTWIRPYSLLEYGIKEVVHIVGHTPTREICNLKDVLLKKASERDDPYDLEECLKYCDVWTCDALDKRKYLVIENGEFIPKTI